MTTTSLQGNYSTILNSPTSFGSGTVTVPNVSIGATTTGLSYITNSSITNNNSVMTVNGSDSSLTVMGKVIINGADLEERLSRIEQVLGIPPENIELHKKYPKLKQKYDDYINDLSKYNMWRQLDNE